MIVRNAWTIKHKQWDKVCVKIRTYSDFNSNVKKTYKEITFNK
jgi:hypothetical protein